MRSLKFDVKLLFVVTFVGFCFSPITSTAEVSECTVLIGQASRPRNQIIFAISDKSYSSLSEGSKIAIPPGKNVGKFLVIKVPSSMELGKNTLFVNSIYATNYAWSPSGDEVAVVFRGSGGSMVEGAEMQRVYVYDGRTGAVLKSWFLWHGDAVHRSTKIQWLSTPSSDLIVATYTISPANQHFKLDDDKTEVKAASEILDPQSGQVLASIPHAKGWNRYAVTSPGGSLSLPSYFMLKPKFKIYWSMTGEFFADVQDDTVRIYNVDLSANTSYLERVSSLKEIQRVSATTFGLFATPESRFERQVAEDTLNP